MATLQDVIGHPAFQQLPQPEQLKAIQLTDDYAGLPETEKAKFDSMYGGGEPAPKFMVPPQGPTALRATTWKDTAQQATGMLPIAGSIAGQAAFPEAPGGGAALGYAFGNLLRGPINKEFLSNPLDVYDKQAPPETLSGQAGQFATDLVTGYGAGKVMDYGRMALGVKPPAAPVLNEGRGLFDRLAMGTYKSALKPSTANKLEQNDQMTLTALRERILPFGQASTEKIDVLNNEINRTFNDVLLQKSGPANPQGISTAPIKDSVNKVISFYRSDPATVNVADSLGRMASEFNNMPAYISPQEMQVFRQRWNNQLTDYFRRSKTLIGSTKNEGGEINLVKAARDSASNTIYELAPELKQLGKRQASLIDLNSAIERATNRINNWDIIGLSFMAAGTTGELIGQGKYGAPVAGAGGAILAYRLLSNPNIKARIAFALAQNGSLATASPSTLELIGLTKESAEQTQTILKALPFPKSMPSGIEDLSGVYSPPAPPLYYPQKALNPAPLGYGFLGKSSIKK